MSVLTAGQLRLLEHLTLAYEKDVAVEIGPRTEWPVKAGQNATASRTVARGLVARGVADYSPNGKYLLVRPSGRLLVQKQVA